MTWMSLPIASPGVGDFFAIAEKEAFGRSLPRPCYPVARSTWHGQETVPQRGGLAGVVAGVEQGFAAGEPVEVGVGLVAGAGAADEALVGGAFQPARPGRAVGGVG